MNEVNLYVFILNVVILVFCGLFFSIIPSLTRKSYLFGVKVPPEVQATPEVLALKKNYRMICLLGTAAVLTVIILQYILAPEFTIIATLYFIFLLLPVYAFAYIPNWKKSLALKQEKGWIVSEAKFADTRSSSERGISSVPWIWYIASLAIILITVIVSLIRYPSLPDLIPTHFGVDGADAWSEKSVLVVLMLPLINLGLLAIMVPTAIMMPRVKLQVDQSQPMRSFAQHKVYRKRMGHYLGLLTLTIIISLIPTGLMILWPDYSDVLNTVSMWSVSTLWIIPTILLVVFYVRAGQGGCKLKIDIPAEVDNNQTSENTPTKREDSDDRFWKLGMFYYNPDDPAYVVEDRFGTNIGFNYAKTAVKIGMGILVAGVVAIYVWTTILMASLI